MAIHEQSEGVPRTINVICENALLIGFAAGQRPVGLEIVSEICGDLDLLPRQESVVRSRVQIEAMLKGAVPRRQGSLSLQPEVESHAPAGERFSIPYLRWGRR